MLVQTQFSMWRKTGIFIIKNFNLVLLRNKYAPPIYSTGYKLGKRLLAQTGPKSAHLFMSYLDVNNAHSPPALFLYAVFL